MSKRGLIRPATLDDVPFFAENLRDIDRLEFDVMSGGKPLEDNLASLIDRSRAPLVGEDDGEPFTIFGVVRPTLISGTGHPWMAATPKIEERRVARTFLGRSREGLGRIAGDCNFLWNLVHEHNETSIRWLKWMQFVFTGESYDIRGHKFLYFKMEPDDVF
jgi:hypothetical protein